MRKSSLASKSIIYNLKQNPGENKDGAKRGDCIRYVYVEVLMIASGGTTFGQ